MKIFSVAKKYNSFLKGAVDKYFPLDPSAGNSPWPVWHKFLLRITNELLQRANKKFGENYNDLRDHGIKLHLEKVEKRNKFKYDTFHLILSPFTLKEKFISNKLDWAEDELEKMTDVIVIKRTSLSGE